MHNEGYMSALMSAAIGGLAGAIVSAIGGLGTLWLRSHFERKAIKFSKWQDKRIAAVEAIYVAFCEYLDFLRKELYWENNGIAVDPMWAFRKTMERNILYFDETQAEKLSRYAAKLDAFRNDAIIRLGRDGEAARPDIRHELDTRIPLYLPQIRSDLVRMVDPFGSSLPDRLQGLHGIPRMTAHEAGP
jgi:hypothetical protein